MLMRDMENDEKLFERLHEYLTERNFIVEDHTDSKWRVYHKDDEVRTECFIKENVFQLAKNTGNENPFTVVTSTFEWMIYYFNLDIG